MDKIRLVLDVPLTDLEGKPLKDSNNDDRPVTAGKALAANLAQSSKGDAIKYFAWALELYAGKSIEVDESDYDKLLSFVKDHETMTVLSKAQLIQFLKGAKAEFDYQQKNKDKDQ